MSKQFDDSLFEFVTEDHSYEQEEIQAPSRSFWADAWHRLTENKTAVASLVILVVIVVIAVFAPVLAPHDPLAQNPRVANLPPKIPGLENFSWFNGEAINRGGVLYDAYERAGLGADVYYYMGTDALGRDLLSRIMYGTRISLIIAFVAAVINLLIGVSYGLISGWKGGKVDQWMQRLLEVISGIPNLVIVVLMLLVLEPGLMSIIITVALTSWVSMSRVVRAQTIRLKQQEYVLAARVLGQSTTQILMNHILPNVLALIVIQIMFALPSAIFFEAFLSFIGIGIPAPSASLGSLVNEGYKTFRFLPHLMWYPAGVISILMLAFNLLADGLRDALDSKLRE